jgi:hypothetical protein
MTPAQGLAYNPVSDQIIVRTPTATAQQFSISFVPFTTTTPDFLIVSGLGQEHHVQRPGRLPRRDGYALPGWLAALCGLDRQ